MKNTIPLALIITIALFACKPKEEHCSIHAYKAPAYIAFRDFTPAELDTVIISRYEPGSSFSKLLERTVSPYPNVALDTPNGILFADTSKTNMGIISGSYDYRISTTSSPNFYSISDMEYSGDTVVEWTSTTGCTPISSFTVQPQFSVVDGRGYVPIRVTGKNDSRWIVLSK